MSGSVSSGTDFLRAFPAGVVDDLTALCGEECYGAGQRIHARGDASHGLYGVLDGMVRISLLGPDGRELVLGALGPGHWFGEIGLLDGAPRTHHADAVGPTRLLTLRRSAFLAYAAEHPEMYHDIALLLCRRQRFTFSLLEDMTMLPLEARTARRLVGLTADFGATVPISQEELARMTSGSREAVGRILNSWKTDAAIRIGYRQITVVDADYLNRVGKLLDR
ncbi:MAG TPA: Crp/Fnr family transcriptional regulator [Baekduia sp.]|nr:Crp/Fnr family transcriptional regulator [Baekduia sp.]